eukprot:XP_003728546.1 PREDICTED: monocarboxylate transporter 4 [Strongylocentrotus purpuratus]
MATHQSEDSKDPWKYTIVVSKFVINCIEVAISKSFGVLIPVMINILSTNTKTIGLACSMPSAWMNIACPAVAYVLKTGVLTPRMIALIGAFLSSAFLIAAGFTTSIPELGLCLSLTGVGLSMGYLSTKVLLNEYFKRSYVLMAAVTNLGSTTGAFIAPFVIERSLEAYGYIGAMLILAAFSLHAIPASATLRKPRDRPSKPSMKKKNDHEATGSDEKLVREEGDEYISKEEPESSTRCITKIKEWLKDCIFIREPLFTMTLPCLFFTLACLNAWVLFLVPRAEGHGIPSSKAVFVSTAGGAGGIVGRVFFIALLYFGANPIVLSCVFFMMSAVTFLADPFITTFPVMCVVAFIQGWSVFSCNLALSGYLKYSVSDENFTMAAGIDGLVSGLGRMSGGFLGGLIKDATQSFTTVFVGIGFGFCFLEVNALLFLLALRRKQKKRANDL